MACSGFNFCRIFVFRVWLWVLWDRRTVMVVLPGCPTVGTGTSRLSRRGFRSLQTTIPMNWHVCVTWGSRRRGVAV